MVAVGGLGVAGGIVGFMAAPILEGYYRPGQVERRDTLKTDLLLGEYALQAEKAALEELKAQGNPHDIEYQQEVVGRAESKLQNTREDIAPLNAAHNEFVSSCVLFGMVTFVAARGIAVLVTRRRRP